MEYITLKHSDLLVSRIAMGGCPMGGYGWGKVQESELLEAVDTALEAGCNFFDTADTYGLGQAEETLGKALKGKRSQAVIATKFGVRAGNGQTFYDNRPDYIRKALEDSLHRLGTDYIDLYQIHYRDGRTPLETVVETLEDCHRKGYIRYFGLSNIQERDAGELKQYGGKFVSFQDEYSLACRKNETDIQRIAKEYELTPITWGSLGQGILTGKYGKDCNFGPDDRRSRDVYVNFHGKKLEQNLEIVETMRKVQKEYEQETGEPMTLTGIAIRFILDYIPQSVVIAGAKNPEQVKGNLKASGWNLNKEQIAGLEQVSRERRQERV